MGKNTQGEELSRCLDILNDGDYPVMQDKEIEELIEIAAAVKDAHTHEELPRVLIAEIVDNLASELGAKKQQKKQHIYWLYGGLVCAAATVFIAIATQFLLPQSFDKNIAQEMKGNLEQEKVAVVTEQGSTLVNKSTNDITSERVEAIHPVTINAEKITVDKPAGIANPKPDDSIAKVLVEIIQVAQSKVDEEKTNQVAVLEKKTSKQKNEGENLLMATMDVNSVKQTERQMKVQNIMPTRSEESLIEGKIIQDGINNGNKKMAMTRSVIAEDVAYSDKLAEPLQLTMIVNRKEMQLQAYMKEKGTVMIPLKVVAETLGYKVESHGENVKLTKSTQWSTFKIGEDNYISRERPPVTLGECAEIIEGTIYVPLQFFSEVLQMNVLKNKEGIIKIHELVL